MAKYRIFKEDARCTGCLRCQLACSYLYTRSFRPSGARVRVDFRREERTITFSDDCVSCGACVDNCLYGALQKAAAGGQE